MTDNGEIPTPIEEASVAKAPEDPRIKGYLAPPTMKLMQSLQKAAQDVVQEIGMCEVRKARLLSNLAEIEGRIESAVSGEAQKMGIPEGAPFQMGPNGAILEMGPPATPNVPSAEG